MTLRQNVKYLIRWRNAHLSMLLVLCRNVTLVAGIHFEGQIFPKLSSTWILSRNFPKLLCCVQMLSAMFWCDLRTAPLSEQEIDIPTDIALHLIPHHSPAEWSGWVCSHFLVFLTFGFSYFSSQRVLSYANVRLHLNFWLCNACKMFTYLSHWK